VDEHDQLAGKFEENRAQLRAVAYRMLGSISEAEDAVQEAWLRVSRSDTSEIKNLGAWLTTVVSRLCLDQLRSRKTRREDSLDVYVPDPILGPPDPEEEAVQADAVGLAMMVVLEKLSPSERLAFVLHDMFGLSFDEVAEIVDKTPAATRQLASRARRRVQGAPVTDTDVSRHREVVDAFLAASRSGDFEALLAVLDPDVILRADTGTTGAGPGAAKVLRGALAIVEQAVTFTKLAPPSRPAIVNGYPGLVTVVGGTLRGVMDVTVRDGKIIEINILSDPARLKSLPIPA
jgi:RNA polymerase sigma-70 factor (ECF subfamily)